MNKNYPEPTKSIEVAKNDLKKWGYCLLENAIPADLNKKVLERLVEQACLLYTSPSPRDRTRSRMPSSA